MRSLDGWLAINVLGLDPAVLALGWGGTTDMPLYYIHVLVLVILAAVTALVWSLLGRDRSRDPSLHAWARLLVRYFLANSLFTYGFAKVFLTQMAPAWMYLERLVEPFGNMSPAGLLWAFVGYSPSYQIFSGLAEVVAGLLLLFRRTTTLGALVAVGVLLNVVMLNFSYQVDVKVSSVNLLLSAAFLTAPDLGKLARFFVFNQRVDPPDTSDPVVGTRWRTAVPAFKVVFAVLILYKSISFYSAHALFSPPSNRPMLSGLYDVETFVLNGHEHAPLTTDPTRWKTVAIGDPPTAMHVQMMDASFLHYSAEYDEQGRSVTLFVGNDRKNKYVLQCTRPDQDHLTMEGTLGNDALTIRMRTIDPSSFSILNSRFRWTGRTDIH
ncbi:MAG TPA: DoxX family protein [Vicinamibacterales bacterium]|nr:DoxX family protein [Vicinamibacterales bacterium]